MIKLCSGSVFKTISLAKGSSQPSDEDLAKMLYIGSPNDGSYIRQVKSCDKNLPYDIKRMILGQDPHGLILAYTESCKKVLNMIHNGKHEIIALILLDIIEQDNSFRGTINGYTKMQLADIQELYLPTFLANLIIDTAIANDNTKGKDGIKELNAQLFKRHEENSRRITLLSEPVNAKSPESATIGNSDYGMIIDANFEKYMQAQMDLYEEKNIAINTPQLLSMALKYPHNIALDILNYYRNQYGNQLLYNLKKIDKYYIETGQTYNEGQRREFEKMIQIGIEENGELMNKIKHVSPCIFCYFILNNSNGQTVDMIKEHLGEDFTTVVGFMKREKCPSFPPNLKKQFIIDG